MEKKFLKFTPNVELTTIPLIDEEINHLDQQINLIKERIKYIKGLKRGMIEGLYSTSKRGVATQDRPFVKLLNQIFTNNRRLLSVSELAKFLPYKENYIRNVLRRSIDGFMSYDETGFVLLYGPSEFFDLQSQLPLKQFMPSYEIRESQRKSFRQPDENSKRAKDRGFKLY